MESKCKKCFHAIVCEINETPDRTEIQSYCTFMNKITNNTVKNCTMFVSAIRSKDQIKWINNE